MGAPKLNKESGIVINAWSDVDYQIAEMREKEVEILSLQRSYDDEVLILQKKYMDPKQNFQDEANFIKGKIKDFCDKHRKEMDDKRKKTLTNGEVYYRALPVKVTALENVSNESVIKKIIALGKNYVEKYLRTKTEIDVNSIKKEYTEMKIDDKFLNKLGLETVKGESFSVKPNP